MMDRRAVLMAGGAMLCAPSFARAQRSARTYRVGLIFTSTPIAVMSGPEPRHILTRTFIEALRSLGYIEGQNLVLERRSAEGHFDRFAAIVTELIDRKVDVIVTAGNELALVAKNLTTSVPVVMGTSYDPVGAGLVAGLARPGGNITGFALHVGPEFDAKRLQLLKEALPAIGQVAFLGSQGDWDGPEGQHVRVAAKLMGMTLVHAGHAPTEYSAAFKQIAEMPGVALFVARSSANNANARPIAAFASQNRIAGIYPQRLFVEAGGLMSYGGDLPDLWKRAAGHVDKILRGAKPGDLPVEQPSKFALVINAKTAAALGLTIPPTLLAFATEVIE